MLNEIYQMMDPVAFAVGPFTVRWYGLAYMAGFLCAAFILYRLSKRWRVQFGEDGLATVMLCVIIGVVVGGRLGFILFYGDGYYFQHPERIFAVNEGGMSFHGGLVGCMAGGVVAGLITKMPILTLMDMGAIAAPIGLFFGRCANFINGELWGAPTDLPWGVVFGGAAGMMPRHPSQLYEALLEGVVLFAILIVLSRKRPPRPQGTFIGVFMLGYGMIRFSLEFIRQPDAQLGYLWGGWLTMGQVLSVPLMIGGIALLAYAAKAKRPQGERLR